ncbi:MAG: hypothetical protein ACRCT7_01430 [Shewanella sp.]
MAVTRHSFFVMLTMLALLVQGMAFSGQVMAMPVSNSMDHMQIIDAHCQDPVSTHACCDESAANSGNKSCCEGDSACLSDCNHCLSISVAGTLVDTQMWPSTLAYSEKLFSAIPSLHSLALPTELRPPIV